MEVKVLFINACKFSEGDVRTTADVTVEGQPAQLTFTTKGVAAAKELAKKAGLPEPKYSGKSGTSTKGKHKGQTWQVFTSGTKPGQGGNDGDVDFE